MKVAYDNYYQTNNLFGEPYPELISYFESVDSKLKILDVGCGQGRDSIALARLGFRVVGLDNSTVGINQMNAIAKQENLDLAGLVADIYNYPDYNKFDVILLDSMFHFYSKDAKKESAFITQILSQIKLGTIVIFCVPNMPNIISHIEKLTTETTLIHEQDLTYTFIDQESGSSSKTDYKLLSFKR